MGTYDVRWHAYEQAMKADPAWQRLSSLEKAEQFGRYAQGLQYDEIKAANKLRGQELSVLFANERRAQQALSMVEEASQGTRRVTAGQIDNMLGINTGQTGISHNSLQGMYSDLFGSGEQVPMHRYTLRTDHSNVTASSIDEMLGVNRNIGSNHAEMESVYQNLFGKGEQVPMHGYNLVTDPARITADQINNLHGIGVENHTLRGLNYDYAHLEELSDYKRRLGEQLHRPTEFSPEVLDDLTGHGVNKELDAMNDYYRALEQADDATKIVDNVDDVAKGFNWKKAGKWAAIALGVAALAGLAAWGISKLCKKDEPQVQETPKVETPVEDTPATTEPETPETQETPEAPVEPEVPVTPVIPEPTPEVTPEPTPEVKPELKTEYEAQRGDGIWHIAERYLKDKYANEPDKFENLTTAEKNKMILDETLRIAELNNYELVERTINGKKQIVPNPTLHPGDKVKVQ